MERMRSRERTRAVQATDDDPGGRFAVSAGMLVFLVGLALLFVASAPS